MPRPRIHHDCKSKPLTAVRELFSFDRVSGGSALICVVVMMQAKRKHNAREMGRTSGWAVVFRAEASKWDTDVIIATPPRLGTRRWKVDLRGRVSPILFCSLVDRVKCAAVVEMGLLGFLPAAEDFIDGEKFHLRKLRSIFLQHFR